MDCDVIQTHNVKIKSVLSSAINASFQSLLTLVTIYRALTFGKIYQIVTSFKLGSNIFAPI